MKVDGFIHSAAVLFIVGHALILSVADGQQPTVNLAVGTILGRKETFSDGIQQFNVSEYLGIPYAKPPVNDLRLRKPEPLQYLNSNPYNATYYRSFCVQGSNYPVMGARATEDEDCLYLNVFVPHTASDLPSGHAVMVWIYGGGFFEGASDPYHGTVLAAVGNVIVVTVNYRLNFFGFFSTMDSSSSGNFGLFDQALAIQWVHDNIENFGGDKNRVTLFGESAGAMSVSMQGLYNENFGKIHRVIAQSGVATSPYLDLTRDRTDGAILLAEALDCPADDTYAMVECLRTLSWDEIKNTIIKLTEEIGNFKTFAFNPKVDGDFIKADYRYLNKHQETISDQIEFFKSLDFMYGHNKCDGTVALYLLEDIDLTNFQPTQQDMLGKYINFVSMVGSDGPYSEEIVRLILHEYTNWTDPYSFESIRIQLLNYYTDTLFSAPGAEICDIHLQDGATGSTYGYVFLPVTNAWKAWLPDWFPGADHAGELGLVFGMDFSTFVQWEKTLAVQMMTYWSNFAKSG